ncbi:septum formation initiator family protein [Candidatus Berkiella cookevillensis]|uniref:Cell division protein FtsB n=1 Tax=Candidatus Berkiella cookevillensis TaxID=437022 RepID=A0A0Q9YVE2_9GAMM|nr:septum formation initiator family protein [Candidatus Berkiella cookevillensis]MCS5708383.1 septum formation initiator family protein [Candidatus Berkiella cookevillensis]
MKGLTIALIVLFALLQIRLFFGDGSIPNLVALNEQVEIKQKEVDKLKERNLTLEAEVQDLKHQLGALEERARTDLGMIQKGETFYQNVN